MTATAAKTAKKPFTVTEGREFGTVVVTARGARFPKKSNQGFAAVRAEARRLGGDALRATSDLWVEDGRDVKTLVVVLTGEARYCASQVLATLMPPAV